jgi:response regulator of citrate/malate metabolism
VAANAASAGVLPWPVVGALENADVALSAAQVAELVGASRVTARRYLEYLAEAGLAQRQARYGTAGRPEMEYRLRRAENLRHDTSPTRPES